jgi:hypothetical protein
LFCSRKAVKFDVFKASNGAAGFPAQPMLSAAAPRQKASIFDMRGLLDPLRRGVQPGVLARKSRSRRAERDNLASSSGNALFETESSLTLAVGVGRGTLGSAWAAPNCSEPASHPSVL